MKFHVFPAKGDTNPDRALLIFAGWGMDEKPFSRLQLPGYHLIVVWDYRDSSFPDPLDRMMESFGEIAVIAWSFGVPAATDFLLSHQSLPITARIAVNGTMHPVDDTKGIPEEIFRGTLEGLDEKSLSKFYLRMCGSGAAMRLFSETLPDRSPSELREELTAIANRSAVAPRGLWERAIISSADRIIPPANQMQAWSDEAIETISIEGAHLPDFNRIFKCFLTEKGLVAEKFTRAETTYDDNAIVQREIAGRLCKLASEALNEIAGSAQRPMDVLEIGCGTGLTTRMLCRATGLDKIEVWDLHIPSSIQESMPEIRLSARECDAESEIRRLPAESLDMIFSASTMQWFNSPKTFMGECARVLRKGGHAVISTFGPGTMAEIGSLLDSRRHYPGANALRRMIPEGCTVTDLSTVTRTILFPTPAEAMRHVKLTGVNALSSKHGSISARTILTSYPLTPSGEAPVTYEPVYIVFKKI
ncbi:MAG: DUF452 family protein [Duncaniella sp.]|nr:DUF452 family protein [Duncaniella sp.]